MFRRRDRAHEREISRLLDIIARQNDQIMHLAGRTWNPPPALEPQPTRELEPPEPLAYSFNPNDDLDY